MSRIPPRRTGLAIPALVCLFLAFALLLVHRAGGSADLLLERAAACEPFVARAFSLELGSGESDVPAANAPVFTPASYPSELDLPTPQPAAIELTPRFGEPVSAVQCINESGLAADPSALLTAPLSLPRAADNPTVLIYHTHATEAYLPDGADTYTPSGDCRTTDRACNMVRIGDELAAVLESRGIQVLHLTDLFDYPSYNGSYAASLRAAEQALKDYPGITVTIDIHRDAVLQDNGKPLRTEATVDGQTISQLMLVVGTNASGLSHPDWRENLTNAARLQAALEGSYPGLMRPLYLRRQRFNQHLRPASLLLEVGASGNTLQESLAAVRLFGETLADSFA